MNILSAQALSAWDRYTMLHEPIAAVDLMERAATACAEWMKAQAWSGSDLHFFCGKGNNGGDGLAVARLLSRDGYRTTVHVLQGKSKGTAEWETNLHRLGHPVHYIGSAADFPVLAGNSIVVDALFGAGLNRPLDGAAAALVQHINAAKRPVVSIDLPSGLFADRSSKGEAIVATYTLTFQTLKTGLLLQENAPFIGQVTVLPIGLHPAYPDTIHAEKIFVDEALILALFKKRDAFAHKGSFGHALLLGGGFGKMGAAVLAARACVRTGCGLLSCCIPGCGYGILQTALPEAMVITDPDERMLTQLPEDLEKYAAIGIGPGLGTAAGTQALLASLFTACRQPLVIDADALNMLALRKELLAQVPPQSILTPHPKEFDRLFGEQANDFDRMDEALRQATERQVIIVLKSHHTLVASPGGQAFFNSTGNAGMAKGGSGDVLTGIITSLLSQQYPPLHAALLGVYLHGLAGDLAAAAVSQEAMMPSDTIEALGGAFLRLNARATG